MARRAFHPALVPAVIAVVCLAEPAVAAAEEDGRTQRAKEAFTAGRYREALDLFVELYAETMDPIYLRVIGRCHQKLEDPDRAIDAFQEYLRRAKKLGPDKRKEVEGFIAEMEALRERRRQEAAAAAAAATGPEPGSGGGASPTGPPAAQPARPGAPAPAPPAVAQAPAGVLVGTPSARTETKDADGARFYSRWWFWTAIGVVVSTGIVVGGILAARPDVAPIYMGQDGAPLLDPKIVKIPSE